MLELSSISYLFSLLLRTKLGKPRYLKCNTNAKQVGQSNTVTSYLSMSKAISYTVGEEMG